MNFQTGLCKSEEENFIFKNITHHIKGISVGSEDYLFSEVPLVRYTLRNQLASPPL